MFFQRSVFIFALALLAWIAFGFWARFIAFLFLLGWDAGGKFWN